MSKRVTIAALAALVTTLSVPLLPRTAAAQSAVVYPWCAEPTDSVEECGFTSYAQCRTGNKLCARNGMYYLRNSSAYAAAPYADGSIYAAAPRANGSVYAAAPDWSASAPYTYVPATDDAAQRRRW
jgi:hypothetical protein